MTTGNWLVYQLLYSGLTFGKGSESNLLMVVNLSWILMRDSLLLQVGLVSDYDLLALDSISGKWANYYHLMYLVSFAFKIF